MLNVYYDLRCYSERCYASSAYADWTAPRYIIHIVNIPVDTYTIVNSESNTGPVVNRKARSNNARLRQTSTRLLWLIW